VNGGKAVTGISVTITITADVNLLYDSGGDLHSNTKTATDFS
jgi:hypothetical protein